MIDEWNLIYCKLKSRQIPTKEEQTKCYCGHTTTCDCGPEEPKQEKLWYETGSFITKDGTKINVYRELKEN